MIGQHMFMRCWDENNNAGSWTAAVTEGAADKNILRSEILPCCNIDETFAQKCMRSRRGSNILRIHPLSSGSIVVSRTFWENDVITEQFGRKGAYTVSHIITGKDVDRYCEDFAGCFDESCFETYDSVVHRMQAANTRKVVLDPQYSLFRHRDITVDYGVFAEVGFQKELFVKLMEGLYSALEKNDRLAVVLPGALNRNWVETGDNTAERLMMAILSLLPPETRKKTGMASHWGCSLKADMLMNMHLVFVIPNSQDDLNELRRSGVKYLDLNGASGIPSAAPGYFSSMWDMIQGGTGMEDVWTFCAEKCGGLIRRLPKKASALEIVYKLKKVSDDDYSDAKLCSDAYIAASSIFGGAGKKVPFVDTALRSCLDTIAQDDAPITKGLADAIGRFLQNDKSATEHQAAEYWILLREITRGKLDPSVIDILVHEAEKPDRNADGYFRDYLKNKAELDIPAINTDMVSLVCKLFTVLSGVKPPHRELQELVQTTLDSWSEKLEEAGRWDILSPIALNYVAYLKTGGTDVATITSCYRLLFGAAFSGGDDFCRRCEDELLKEERRIYKDLNGSSRTGQSRLTLLCQAMAEFFPLSEETPENIRKNAYLRLYRMAAAGAAADPTLRFCFDQELNAVLSTAGLQGTDPLLLSCQTAAVSDMRKAANIWSADGIRTSVLGFEQEIYDLCEKARSGLNADAAYWPSTGRLDFLLDVFGTPDREVCGLLTDYLKQSASSGSAAVYRTQLFTMLRDRGQIDELYVFGFIDEDAGSYRNEMSFYLENDRQARLKLFIRSDLTVYTSEADMLREGFADWYTGELETALQEDNDPLRRLSLVIDEYSLLASLPDDLNGLNHEAVRCLGEKALEVINSFPREKLVGLPIETVTRLSQIIARQEHPEGIMIKPYVDILMRMNDLDQTQSVQEMDFFCFSPDVTPIASFVISRLTYYATLYRNRKPNTIAWKYEILRAAMDTQDGGDFITSLSMGPMRSDYNGRSADSLVNLLLWILRSFDFDSSNTLRLAAPSVVNKLKQIAWNSPELFEDPGVQRKIYSIRCLSRTQRNILRSLIARTRGGDSYYNSEDTDYEWPGFSIAICLRCVLGAVLSLLIFAGMVFAVGFFSQVDTWLAFGFTTFVDIVLLFLGIFLWHARKRR